MASTRAGRMRIDGPLDTPRAKARGFLLHPRQPPSEVLCSVHKRFNCRCAPPPAPRNRCPLVSAVFMILLGSRSLRRRRTRVLYHMRATVDAPLASAEAADPRCADSIQPTALAVGFLRDFCNARGAGRATRASFWGTPRDRETQPHLKRSWQQTNLDWLRASYAASGYEASVDGVSRAAVDGAGWCSRSPK